MLRVIGKLLDNRGVQWFCVLGIVVRTTKINSNIKEAKATSFTPPCWYEGPSAGSKVAIDALSSVNYSFSGITSLGLQPQWDLNCEPLLLSFLYVGI